MTKLNNDSLTILNIAKARSIQKRFIKSIKKHCKYYDFCMLICCQLEDIVDNHFWLDIEFLPPTVVYKAAVNQYITYPINPNDGAQLFHLPKLARRFCRQQREKAFFKQVNQHDRGLRKSVTRSL